MTADEAPKQDRVGMDYREGSNPVPGGRVDTGDRPMPPYEGRTTERNSSDTARAQTEAVEREMEHTDPGRHGATASPAVESPAQDDQLTEEVPDSPKGVGPSPQRGAQTLVQREGHNPPDEPTLGP